MARAEWRHTESAAGLGGGDPRPPHPPLLPCPAFPAKTPEMQRKQAGGVRQAEQGGGAFRPLGRRSASHVGPRDRRMCPHLNERSCDFGCDDFCGRRFLRKDHKLLRLHWEAGIVRRRAHLKQLLDGALHARRTFVPDSRGRVRAQPRRQALSPGKSPGDPPSVHGEPMHSVTRRHL